MSDTDRDEMSNLPDGPEGGRPAAFGDEREADRMTEAPEVEPGQPERGRGITRGVREVAIIVVAALLLSFLVQTFVARVYLIPSESMEPTLHGCSGCTGDRIVVDRLVYRFGDPEPGDVVVFRGEGSWNDTYRSTRSENLLVRGIQNIGTLVGVYPPDENNLVKRVIAVGGQTVRCEKGDPGIVVDGEYLVEPYLSEAPRVPFDPAYGSAACGGPYFGPVTVPEGRLWVMGDNRLNSADSRAHLGDENQGTVSVAAVRGKVRFILLPVGRMGGVDSGAIERRPLPRAEASAGPEVVSPAEEPAAVPAP